MQEVITTHSMSWKIELAALVASAKDETESIALEAFQQALTPYLEAPESLRTLLGKIQMLAPACEALALDSDFSTMAELQSMMPDNIEVIAA
ncbi:hypothetical protein RYA05_30680 [Pseudomonas syringae pv. actinidiae]|uniref:Uncharacterized protein n=5 Tax=Pseudomonas syringae group TaxID=136849 RepID=A0A2S3T6P9_9PSED|nr:MULTISPECIES: hypothetical protein [Pseudomonas syringae group]EPN64062.1 hypothetical protein A235_15908 [Pseudomonas syringae pv. actinidiae ICMP 19079]EPN71688.1 hypothetical protein A234_20517 [Pseudomonas syringae pv. actinidiae ICMP 19101]KTC25820.1 hypothetical protein AO391_06300 [Pseudomonas marginalis ICMP 9505]AKT32553.1 hypothetical protein IYO_024125 [Pseudomonas syringae pv. actinidiae ICMP 18884]AOE58881.1 hypothetical protein NZ708_24100 [Pseudomonas syringae pv. actinidiae 